MENGLQISELSMEDKMAAAFGRARNYGLER